MSLPFSAVSSFPVAFVWCRGARGAAPAGRGVEGVELPCVEPGVGAGSRPLFGGPHRSSGSGTEVEAVQYLEGGGVRHCPRWRLSVVEESRLWLVNTVSLRRSLRTRVYSLTHATVRRKSNILYARSFHRGPLKPSETNDARGPGMRLPLYFRWLDRGDREVGSATWLVKRQHVKIRAQI